MTIKARQGIELAFNGETKVVRPDVMEVAVISIPEENGEKFLMQSSYYTQMQR
ncbi:hypothetical protein NC797_06320 [Aquibacillus sp. 3ASR75-11]|uniref:Uncharacterized protein n=1 Tax=Terrihalobacillus insolitus TaxID=2950438 RepID=A0A9X3WQ97_9BACI|nr:hypothetical protein [Terrihalobacillus insolitus]MDC3414032.1 hypothetical protein [Terrihalobacillus insolitus]MDC3424122.1 hypothetical protein [Terrihalobacillus insolitus]